MLSSVFIYQDTRLGCVVLRASDLWSTGWEFDSRQCTAGL